MERVYIAVGSNKGDRAGNIIGALKHIEKYVVITKISPFLSNLPQEGADGGFFMNGVIAGKTGLSPEKLFRILQDVEKKSGRVFPHGRGDEREIDLDIIFYGGRIIKTKEIRVPHPRYRGRYFVVRPLYDIAPDLMDPETKQTVSIIYAELQKKCAPVPPLKRGGRGDLEGGETK
ncbi:MAG: 2-amino-4-hydroxy-6-hydroxymethyldihydropteridine diphosphokinase [Candidatus Omnitrophica bacterium]|nr:2-amino-4-hydroxy-6-hydroxymethyldihydropteridine diphosphokinase [Candidatus Omnitrophota bacterium]